jgi:hypothetical protein
MADYAKKATIQYGGINLEVYQLPNGSYTFSKSQSAYAIGEKRGNSSVNDFIQGNSPEALSIKGLHANEISIGQGSLSIKATPLKIVLAYWTFHAQKGNIKAQALLMSGTEEVINRLADTVFGVVKSEENYQKETTLNVQQNEILLIMMKQLLAEQAETKKQNQLILSELASQRKELLILKPIAEQYDKISNALDYLEELRPLLEKITEELKNNPNQEYKTLKQWLKYSELPPLVRGKNISIGQLVSSFFKIGNLKPLMKPEYKGSTKYPEAFLPVIKQCYRYVLFDK